MQKEIGNLACFRGVNFDFRVLLKERYKVPVNF